MVSFEGIFPLLQLQRGVKSPSQDTIDLSVFSYLLGPKTRFPKEKKHSVVSTGTQGLGQKAILCSRDLLTAAESSNFTLSGFPG